MNYTVNKLNLIDNIEHLCTITLMYNTYLQHLEQTFFSSICATPKIINIYKPLT